MASVTKISLLTIALLSVTMQAFAQVGPDQDPGTMLSDNLLAAEAELGIHPMDSSAADTTSLIPMLRASAHLPFLSVAAQWGMSYVDASGGGQSDTDTVFSNPQFMGYMNLDLVVLELQLGGGLVLPTMGDLSNLEELAAIRGATSRTMRDYWLWAPDTFSIVLPSARAQIDLIPSLLYLSADAEIGTLVPTANTDARDVEFMLQYGAALGVQVMPILRAGLRLQAVAFLSDFGGADDQFYSAFEPFVRLGLGPFYATAHFLMNMDGYPDSLGDSHAWSARISIGGGIPNPI